MNTVREPGPYAQLPDPMASETHPLLSVRGFGVEYVTPSGYVKAVDDVSFTLTRGETLAVIGESGSGKTTMGLGICGLLDRRASRASGAVQLDGIDLVQLNERELRSIRGSRMGVIFQDPLTSLNPGLTIGYQLCEGLRTHEHVSRRVARQRAVELLGEVGLPDAAHRLDDYPHQFSGGMRQRVMIAMALMCEPEIILADEPTTALDASTQSQILRLLSRLCSDLNTSLILITHDLAAAATVCDRFMVMYAGQVVETSNVRDLMRHPLMPYAAGLLACSPTLDTPLGVPVPSIPGRPPNLADLPPGCRFAPRCPHARVKCRVAPGPELTPRHDSRTARCLGTEPGGWIGADELGGWT